MSSPAKHTHHQSSTQDKGTDHHHGPPKTLDRQSNTGYDKSQSAPKKSGAGGGTVWGQAGDAHDLAAQTEKPVFDKNDPNYDEDEEDMNDVDDSHRGHLAGHRGPVDSGEHIQRDFKKQVSTILAEYWNSADVAEVTRALQDLDEGGWSYEVTKQILTGSLVKHNRERELASVLLSQLYNSAISPANIARGFDIVLDRLPDILLDAPNAVEAIGSFIARAVIDDVLPPAYVAKNNAKNKGATEALNRAKRLIDDPRAGELLENIWENKTVSSLKKLKKAMKTATEEYLVHSDVSEAEKTIRQLDVPTLFFQLVKVIISVAIVKKDEDRIKLSALLQTWSKSDFISAKQMLIGFTSCMNSINELAKDITPNAPARFLAFTDLAVKDGYIKAEFAEKAKKEIQKLTDQEKQRIEQFKSSPTTEKNNQQPAQQPAASST